MDDEEPARERLRKLLGTHTDVEIVGEAEDGEQAIGQISSLKPDLVFLDIQMPRATGLEVAASLGKPEPHIIFCTAYDEYAVQAFDLDATDYLLKPVKRPRLAKALDRVREQIRDRPEDAVRIPTHAGRANRRLLARRGEKYVVVQQSRVECLLSEEGSTKLCSDGGDYAMDPTLADLDARLDPDRFYRVSRSAIVNLDHVQEVAPLMGGFGEVLLRSGRRCDVSRRRMKELLERFAGG